MNQRLRCIATGVIRLATGCLLLAGADRALAGVSNWNVGNGFFANPASWDFGVPDSDDTAVFRRGFMAYTVTFQGTIPALGGTNYVNDSLTIGTNEVTFVRSLRATYSLSDSLIIGDLNGDVAILNTTFPISADKALIGLASGSTGALNISAGSFDVTGAEFVHFFVGHSGSGTVNVTGGAQLNQIIPNSDAWLGTYLGSQGTVNVSGAGSNWTVGGTVLVGDKGNGLVNITAGSKWNVGGDIRIGFSGAGKLNITEGGQVSALNSSVAQEGIDFAVATVDGPGSRWDNSGTLTIGLPRFGPARGRMLIQGGGEVTASEGVLGGAGLGEGYARHGETYVTGAGSKWTVANDLTVGEGELARGELYIEFGGQVSNSLAFVASSPGSVGVVSVDGTGSMWTTSDLFLGNGGQSYLGIFNGGLVTNASANVAFGSHANAYVEVASAGSRWTTNGNVNLGGSGGVAVLDVYNGGGVSVGGVLAISSASTVKGNGTIIGNMSNSGLVSPGASPGTLHVTGNYSQNASGKLRIEAASPMSFDKLQVTGNIALNGSLDIVLDGGYQPIVGAAFDILDWTGSRSGTFSMLNLPQLTGSLIWDTSQLYSTGVLRVTDQFAPADFQQDGDVDGGDLTNWRIGFGTTGIASHTQGDADDDHDVDGADILVWQRQLAPTAPVISANASVPEPATSFLFFVAAGGFQGLGGRMRQEYVGK